MTPSIPRPVVYTPDLAGSLLRIPLTRLMIGKVVTPAAVRMFDEAFRRQRVDPALLPICFTAQGTLFGTIPCWADRRLGFIAPRKQGADSSHLATRAGRERFADRLRAFMQELCWAHYDVEDPARPRLKHFLNTVLSCMEWDSRGELNPDLTVIAAKTAPQAGSRIVVFDFGIGSGPENNGGGSGGDGSGVLPLPIVLLPNEPALLSDIEFDELVFPPSWARQNAQATKEE